MSDLNSVIERASSACLAPELSEPASLPAARRKVEEEATRLRTVEIELDAVLQQLADYPVPSPLQRLWGPAIDPGRHALEIRLAELQKKFQFVRTYHSRAKNALEIEQRQFEVDRARHEAAFVRRKSQAEKQIATARAALLFLERNPKAAFWGAPYLMRVAASLQKARAEWQMLPNSDLPSDWDLVDIVDIWNKPYQRPPIV